MKKFQLNFWKQRGAAKSQEVKPPRNPYVEARHQWNHHAAGLMQSLKLWQAMALVSSLTTLACIAGLMHVAAQSKFIPLVFQQDNMGNLISLSRADRIAEAKPEDFRKVAAEFIENLRTITPDVDLQRKSLDKAYAYLKSGDPAKTKANAFFTSTPESSPLVRASKEVVNLEIRSVIQESDSSWQIDWIETVRNRDGSLKEPPFAMRAILSLYQDKNFNAPNDTAVLRNPHFLFVRDFHISKLW